MRVNVDVRLSGNCGKHAEAVFDKADRYTTTYLPQDQNQDVLSYCHALSQLMARTDLVISFTGGVLQTTFFFMHAIVAKSTL